MLLGEIQDTFKRLENLPTLPSIAGALLKMAVEENVRVEEITSIIEADPATSARLLRIVNSAYRGLPGKVSSVNRAIVLLGFNGVRNALLSVQIFGIFGDKIGKEKGLLYELWKHSLAVGSAAELVAENTGGILPEDAFTAGLLHDLGKVALYSIGPDEYQAAVDKAACENIEISEAEEAVFKTTHAAAGRFLAEKWGLPEALARSIYRHHETAQAPDREDPAALATVIVSVADDIVRRQRIGYSGTPESWESLEEIFGRIGLTCDNARDILTRLVERVSLRSAILDFNLPEAAVYYECLGKANAALGSLNEKYQQAQWALERSSRRLEAVTSLHAGLGSSFGTGDVLAGMAQKVHDTVAARKVIAYCVDDQGRSVSGSVMTGSACAKSFFISLVKDAANDVAALDADRDALLHLVNALGGRLDAETGTGSLVAGRLAFYPIAVGRGQRAGLLIEAAGAGPLDDGELRFLADSAALALERALLEERLRAESQKLVDSNRRSRAYYDELVNARKLAALGRMAAGAAHEINNPLAIISGRVQLLLKMEAEEGKHRHLDMIRSQCDRMSRIISDILTFARPEKPALKPIDPSDVVGAAVALVEQAAAARRVAVSADIPAGLPKVLADEPKIEQAFRNILANAVDACADGGSVTVTVQPDEKGKFLAFGFADNGSGMDEETLGRIFEPFFTTKEGRGTGLGLAICHSIIQTHGGKIRVKSAPGKGTLFTVLIPVEKAP
jgi:putative nucleotidyltransferase with HDIG domain